MLATDVHTLGLRFKQIAHQYPSNRALAAPEPLAYAALDAKSDQIATHLLKAGLTPGSIVAILAGKHPLTYATMLAALKIGAPYAILDVEDPKERRDRILERCNPALLVSASPEFAWNDVPGRSFAELDAPAKPLPSSIVTAVRPDAPACLLFTSSPTGYPRGVMISHAALLGFCHWARQTFRIEPHDVLSGVHPLHLDHALFDVTATLFNGACLLPLPEALTRQPGRLIERTKECTIWFSTPSLLMQLMAAKALHRQSWPHMRAILFGGETYPKGELKQLHALFAGKAALWHVYGAAECSGICSAYRIIPADFDHMHVPVPLGPPSPGIKALVMDASGRREVVQGGMGELYLYGPQVASGYYHDEEQTRAAFTVHPLKPKSGERCFRTGNLVRRDLETGLFQVMGRKDHQIMHRGHRIEPGEIESALASFPEVAQAAVIYRSRKPGGGQFLAFVTTTEASDGHVLKRRLHERLPSAMIPDAIVLVNAFPLTSQGGIDRVALASQADQEKELVSSDAADHTEQSAIIPLKEDV